MNKILTLVLVLLASCLFAQSEQEGKYWISFSDKNNNPYQLDQPEAFLSERAITRRNRQGIFIDQQDLPVTPSYLNQLQKAGAKILHTSKWLNAATVLVVAEKLDSIRQFPFVKSITYVGRKLSQHNSQLSALYNRPVEKDCDGIDQHYGYAQKQIELLNGIRLHDLNHRGEGMMIAILDGGFSNVEQLPFFDSLLLDHRLQAGRDFVQNDLEVFESSSHGTQVLSVMGANWPGRMVGTAPAASYLCIKTEDIHGEYRVEECNWIAGAEYADSLGADIINSSLGYTTFSDSQMNYDYSDLDGHTSLAALAANVAFQKGILVVNSAGNSGGHFWKYIGVPADAAGVLTVGGSDQWGNRLDFSSIGPTADGRLKPNVVSLGENIAIAAVYSCKIHFSDGTSFAAPTVSGMAASLWSAFPNVSNKAIIHAIQEASHLSQTPNNEQGYGMPDFYKAYELLNQPKEAKVLHQGPFQLYPSVFKDELTLDYFSESGQAVRIEIYDLHRELQYQTVLHSQIGQKNHYVLNGLESIDPGQYFLKLIDKTNIYQFKLLKSFQ